VKSESKFWQEVKAKLSPHFVLTRTDLATVSGWPDVVLYNKNGTFLTVELKVAQSNSVRFSPHQIGFHILHPKNTFILVLDARLSLPKLYKGSEIQQLASRGLKLEPFVTGWPLIIQHFASL
jgi:hypothetical protein